MDSEVTIWMEGPDGTRACSLKVDGCSVLVRGDSSAKAEAVARALAADGARFVAERQAVVDAHATEMAGLRAQLTDLSVRLGHAQARLPPRSPARIMNTGFVRFDNAGRIWLLGNREHGWAAFGYWCESWDDLFRRWDVVVTGHGQDEHGQWWSVENSPDGGGR